MPWTGLGIGVAVVTVSKYRAAFQKESESAVHEMRTEKIQILLPELIQRNDHYHLGQLCSESRLARERECDRQQEMSGEVKQGAKGSDDALTHVLDRFADDLSRHPANTCLMRISQSEEIAILTTPSRGKLGATEGLLQNAQNLSSKKGRLST